MQNQKKLPQYKQILFEQLEQIPIPSNAEKERIQKTQKWIQSTDELYRIKKNPEYPKKHLCAYALILDPESQKFMILVHKSSGGLLLPSGGHVDTKEAPYNTAQRELKEELNVSLPFHPRFVKTPIMLSVVDILDLTPGIVHVDFWYLFIGSAKQIAPTLGKDYNLEFDGHYWLTAEEILDINIKKLAPDMHNVINKLKELNVI